MSITSFDYLLMLTTGVVLYYILPKTWQWVELLVLSIIFYCASASPTSMIWIGVTTITAYLATMFMTCKYGKTPKGKQIAAVLSVAAIAVNVLLWFVFKGTGLWEPLLSRIGLGHAYQEISNDGKFVSLAALGMGYYTLQVIGYILDCYWENIIPQKNPLKLLLFVCFFPQMTTGPINGYDQLKVLYDRHSFAYKNVTFGAQRILWGFFKKLVLAERVGILVNGIWGNLDIYSGFFRWIALLLFPIQMYADFSGCMDIVLGTAEMFGISMAENFNSPFFSKTIQEFWQRWHITLGVWAKNYVLYPLLKCRPMVRFSKYAKKKLGKKWGKFAATAVGMFVLWMVMGIWHGAFKYVIGVSLWYWVLLMLGDLFSPMAGRMTHLLKIQENSMSWHLFQSVRTYLIYAVGAAFFRADDIREGLRFLISLGDIIRKDVCNPWIFFDGSICSLGVTYQDLNIIIFAAVLLLIAGILREKYGYARVWMEQQILVFRWGIWIALFVFVLIYGQYGPGYSAAEFLYQGF